MRDADIKISPKEFCKTFKCDNSSTIKKCWTKNSRHGEWKHTDKGGTKEKSQEMNMKYDEITDKNYKCPNGTPNTSDGTTGKTGKTDGSQTVMGETVLLGTALGNTALNAAQTAFISSSNLLLLRMKGVVDQFVPSAKDADATQELNSQLISEIEATVKSPIFQKKWKKFSEVFADLMKKLIDACTRATATEVEAIAGIFEKTGIRIFKKSTRGAISAISDVISDVPGLGAVVTALSVFTTAASVGGASMISSFELTARVLNGVSRVVGGTLDPTIKAIKSFEDIMSTIQHIPQSTVKELKDSIPPGASAQLIDTLAHTTKTVQDYNKGDTANTETLKKGGNKKKKHRNTKRRKKRREKQNKKRSRKKVHRKH